MLRFLTAGESHGKNLTVIIEGLPADVPLEVQAIDRDLARRQVSYGRGKRMEIEEDRAEITSGVRWGKTLGSPISVRIVNQDWPNWEGIMSVRAADIDDSKRVTRPRPGHADLAGALKYNQKDVRNILERASARETAARVAVGAVSKAFLRVFDIRFLSYSHAIGGISVSRGGRSVEDFAAQAEQSELRCPDEATAAKIKCRIDEAKAKGDTVGGVVEIVVMGLPPGLGSHVHWDRRLDARLAFSLMSIPAVKGVEVGLGVESAHRLGSEVHDEIVFGEPPSGSRSAWGFYRTSNNAGGIEGGISTGEPLVVRCAMKPIATLMKPLKSVDIIDKKPVEAAVERSDVCRVPSLAVIGEAAVAFEIARAFLEKFGGDALGEVSRNYETYLHALETF